jgi:hypothetical protein
MTYSYNRIAAEEDNTFGMGHVPLPPSLSHLGRYVANLAPAKLVSHKVFVKEKIHMLTCKVNTQLSCMALDLKTLLKLGLTRIQCNELGTLSFYFEGYDATPVTSIDPEVFIKQAEKLGQEAFKAGLKHVPRLDVAFVRLHDSALDKMPPAVEGSPATMSARIRFSTKLAEAWVKGWELANLAEP